MPRTWLGHRKRRKNGTEEEKTFKRESMKKNEKFNSTSRRINERKQEREIVAHQDAHLRK